MIKNIFMSSYEPDIVDVEIEDIGMMFSYFIQDNGHTDVSERDNVSEAINNTISLLEAGFKNEPIKGQLFYALHHSLNAMNDAVNSSNDGSGVAKIKQADLNAFKTSYVQFKETALLFSGSDDIPKDLREYFPDNGNGHAPDQEKYKGVILKDIVSNAAPAFLEKYPAAMLTDDELDFYSVPEPDDNYLISMP